MFKLTSEDTEQVIEFFQTKIFLDFLLYNFKQNGAISKVKESNRLVALRKQTISFAISS